MSPHPPRPADPLIRLRNVRRIYQVGDQAVHALDGVSLDIEAGEYAAIMGPSGSGKSTLLHILGLLDTPTAGSYRLAGREVAGLGDEEQARIRRERIGFVFQFFHLLPRLSAAENVALPMMLAGVPPAEREPRVVAALDAVGLADRAGHRPGQLSGGQRQRVAIARAIIMRPDVLLADEPTGNLDTRSGEEVFELLERLHDRGLTLLVVTHDPGLARRAARIIRIVDGRIVSDQARDALEA